MAVPQVYFHPVRVGFYVSGNSANRRVLQFPPNSRWSNKENLLDATEFLHEFDGNRVYHALQKLFDEDLRGGRNRRRAARVVNVAYRCIQRICPDLLVGNAPQTITTLESLEAGGGPEDDIPEELLHQPIQHYGMGVVTRDSEQPLYVGELSTGTQGLFLWILFFALKLADHYDHVDGWENRPGVMFIDEVENHLHPLWQRKVIPALHQSFPNVQIFATTHSPFVVAGLKKGQVHKIYREGGVLKTASLTDEEREVRIEGWTVEEILREFMEVYDPTDAATAEAAGALRWLRNQPPYGATAEEWRQEKLRQLEGSAERTGDEDSALIWLKEQGRLPGNAEDWWKEATEKLRAIVTPDIEAGGPIAAERELFLAQLAELLGEEETSEESEADGEA